MPPSQPEGKLVIDPRNSNALRWWDTIAAIALVYTAMITPYEVGFMQPATSATSFTFIISRMIDGVFFIDVVRGNRHAATTQSRG